MKTFKMKSSIPAPTIVPTKADVNSGTPDIPPTELSKVGTNVTLMITAMIAEMKPVTYSFISGILSTEIRIGFDDL